ncbi:MAG: hypothetical protein ACJ74Q_06215 [Pyrinomonadaceae bacterium]
MSTNITPNAPPAQHTFNASTSPEVYEALRTLRASEFRLEAEFYTLDDNHVDELARVIDDLEDIGGADFSSWDERTDVAARIRRVIRSVEKGVTASA